MKHYQESEVEFRRESDGDSYPSYPVARGIVIYQYGGDLEECVEKARKEFKLGSEWKLIRCNEASV